MNALILIALILLPSLVAMALHTLTRPEDEPITGPRPKGITFERDDRTLVLVADLATTPWSIPMPAPDIPATAGPTRPRKPCRGYDGKFTAIPANVRYFA